MYTVLASMVMICLSFSHPYTYSSKPSLFLALVNVFCISIPIVIGPTPTKCEKAQSEASTKDSLELVVKISLRTTGDGGNGSSHLSCSFVIDITAPISRRIGLSNQLRCVTLRCGVVWCGVVSKQQ